jgi:hypothetical protein
MRACQHVSDVAGPLERFGHRDGAKFDAHSVAALTLRPAVGFG